MATKTTKKQTHGKQPAAARKRAKAATASKRQTRVKQALIEDDTAVYGVYARGMEARSAVQALRGSGFPDENISAAALTRVDMEQAWNARTARRDTGGLGADLFRAGARLTGTVLGLGSLAVAAPLIVGLPILGGLGLIMGDALNMLAGRGDTASPAELGGGADDNEILLTVKCDLPGETTRAAQALESASGGRMENDLKQREYRDEEGVVHHHTRTYARDHGRQI